MHKSAKGDPALAKTTRGVHCQHIRHKAMFVMSQPNPAAFRFFDPYDSAAYWCGETASAFGPDGHAVRPDCCSGDRGCCSH
jgi:hypothetical protein